MKFIGNLTPSQSRRVFCVSLCLLAAIGAVTGAVYGALHDNAGRLWLCWNYLALLECGSAPEVIKVTFLASAVFLLAAYFAGLFAFGQPIGAAMIFFRGFGAGLASAWLYRSFGADAAAKVFTMLLPYSMAVIALSIITVRELMRASGCVLKMWITGETRSERIIDLRLYSLKFAVLLLISLLISVADGAAYLIKDAVG